MGYRGKGRFMMWKEAALEVVEKFPEGISAEALLDRVSIEWDGKRTPANVRQATELLKRDKRFKSHYPERCSKSLSGQWYKVLQWVKSDEE